MTRVVKHVEGGRCLTPEETERLTEYSLKRREIMQSSEYKARKLARFRKALRLFREHQKKTEDK